MKSYFVIIGCMCFMVMIGCEREMQFKQSFDPKIVVNSLLNPDSLLTVDLLWSKNIDESSAFRRVENASVSIYENGLKIRETISGNKSVKFDFKPLVQTKYSIVVKLDGYSDVTAETVIPAKPQVDCVFDKRVKVPGSAVGYDHYDIKSMKTDGNTSAVYLDALTYYDSQYDLGGIVIRPSQRSIYTSSIYTDNFNRTIYPEHAIYTGSPDEYFLFVRIPEKNIEKASPIHFSVGMAGEMWILDRDNPEYEWTVYATTDVTLTAASYDYDSYYKNVFIYMDSTATPNPFVFEIYPIPSNVKNGLGIFAGYSQQLTKFDFNKMEL